MTKNNLSHKLNSKLRQLPQTPGVYLHKSIDNEIIYVGKASNLRYRVRSYFQAARNHDFKTKVMVGDIDDVDWLEVGSEVEALFLESAMIKRYQPKYNVLLRDDKNFLYVKLSDDEFPSVSYTRRPMDDKSEYFGPFTSSWAVKNAMKYLRKAFPYVTHTVIPKRACLQHHLGLCPGPEVGAISGKDYKTTLRYLRRYLSGKGGEVVRQLKSEMQSAATGHEYELAARLRDQLHNLEALERQHLFRHEELFDVTRDQALVDLKQLLQLENVPRRIECYDISHLQGTHNVASMVVFQDGVPNRSQYRKFKLRLPGNDDFGHMREVISRRLQHLDQWGSPDLIIIDGGKGQLGAALDAMKLQGTNFPVIGLAKRLEEIVCYNDKKYHSILLPKSSHALKLLQHARDEAHRFAVTYHSTLRGRAQTASLLESVTGVGPVTRRKLIKQFGSYKGVMSATVEQLTDCVGDNLARKIIEHATK